MPRFVTPLLLVLLVSGCAGAPKSVAPQGPRLDPELPWYADNRQRIDELLTAPNDAKIRRVAVFDWDNTVIKGDVSDALTHYLLNNDLILKPRNWQSMSRHLTGQAVASLNKHCSLRGKEKHLSTKNNQACATALLCTSRFMKLWDGVKNPGTPVERCSGAEAFHLKPPAEEAFMEPGYGMTVSLHAGYTPAEIGKLTLEAWKEYSSRDLGAKVSIGYLNELAFSVRLYEQMKDLITKLKASGFDTWVLTASNEFVVEAVAKELVGIEGDHVIGVKPLLDEKGRMTEWFEGCGSIADRQQDIITYKTGKRCFLNKVAYQLPPAAQQGTPGQTTFAAGDSDTDAAFVSDAKALRLAINRNKPELMCRAFDNADGRWLVNPMFLLPNPKQPKLYSCAAYKSANGAPIVDQPDKIF